MDLNVPVWEAYSGLLLGWVLAMGLDLTGGVGAALRERAPLWPALRENLWQKTGMAVVVLVATGADHLMGYGMEHLPVLVLPGEYQGLLCPLVLAWYAVIELKASGEKALRLGAPAPKWLFRLLTMGREAVERAGGDTEDTSRPEAARTIDK